MVRLLTRSCITIVLGLTLASGTGCNLFFPWLFPADGVAGDGTTDGTGDGTTDGTGDAVFATELARIWWYGVYRRQP